MNLFAVNGVNGDREEAADYLDVTSLQDGKIYEKVALVTSATPGVTKMNSGFAKFFLKDVNANVVCARLFDVQDFAFSGIKLQSFKNKPVKLKFIVQEYNGSLSLVIDQKVGIQTYSGKFDYERFIGKVDYDDSDILACGTKLFGPDWSIDTYWRTASIDDVGQGRVGAFMKVFSIALNSVASYADVSGIDSKSMLKIFYVSMESLYHVKRYTNVFGIYENVKIFDYLASLNQKYYDDDLRAEIMDASKAIAGVSKPTGIYSHLICNAIDNAIRNLDLILTCNGLLKGTSTYTGGVLLSKY